MDRTYTHNGAGDGMGGAYRNPSQSGAKQSNGAGCLRAESANGPKFSDL